MIDIAGKDATRRTATALGSVRMLPDTLKMITEEKTHKGDVLGVARLAGIMGAKQTSQLIPLCHQIQLTSVSIEFQPLMGPARIEIKATVTSTGKTGVEMEALTAVSVAALAVYDMVKSVDRAMEISDIRVIFKGGGKSGRFEGRE